MTFRTIFLAALALTLSACATMPDISQSRSPCRTEPGGWCAFMRDAAVEAYPYAIAATNAYTGDDDLFVDLGSRLVPLERLPIAEEDADKGFGYELFTHYAPGTADDPTREPIARILAFRGTDFDGFTDIFYGTLRNDQIEIAVDTYEAEAARFDDDIPWVVVGHSLGGALATEVSIEYPTVRAYMFNTSPFYGGDGMTNDMRRTVINERGEVLRRFAQRTAPAADVYTLNCGPENDSFTKHRIRLLADCLIWIAAYEDDEAGDLIQGQAGTDMPIRKPMVECGPADKPHPGTERMPNATCVHQSRLPKADSDD